MQVPGKKKNKNRRSDDDDEGNPLKLDPELRYSFQRNLQVAIIAELKGSGKASEMLMMIYYPFLGLGLSAMLRGLLPNCDDPALPKRHVLPRKKRV